MVKRRKWILKEKRPIVTVTGSHEKTIVFGTLSLVGRKQLFRQYDRFDSHSFISYLEEVQKKFKKFVMFVDRATQHRSKMVEAYLQRNIDTIRMEYFPVGLPLLNAVEECWRQGKYNIIQETATLPFQILNKQYQTITEQKDLTWISKSIFLGLLTNVCQYRTHRGKKYTSYWDSTSKTYAGVIR